MSTNRTAPASAKHKVYSIYTDKFDSKFFLGSIDILKCDSEQDIGTDINVKRVASARAHLSNMSSTSLSIV